MEVSTNGWVVLAVMLTILGIGGVAITTTTLRPLGRRTPFKTPITDLSTPISGEARHQFNQGILAYRERAYTKAIDCFSKVLDCEPTLAEAWHNRARARANLAKKQAAVGDFVTASDIYDRQGTKAGIDWIKTDLDILVKF